MSKSIWIMEDFANGTWKPFHIYNSEASAVKELERIKEFSTHIPRRIKEYRPVEDGDL